MRIKRENRAGYRISMAALAAVVGFSVGAPVALGHEGHDRAVDEMAAAAEAFLVALDDAQRAKASFEWSDKERVNWHFVPLERQGVAIKDMRGDQRALAFGLLGSGLSQRGMVQAATIMSLEQILAEMENNPEKRDPEKYWVAVFGTPGGDSTWGWRIEGHHLSVNFTIVNGAFVAGTPSFFGSNPGVVKEGPRKGTRVLGREEDLGRELVKWLLSTGKKDALFTEDPPNEILTGQESKVEPLEDKGVLASDMSEGQQALLMRIVREFVERNRPELAASDLLKIEQAGTDKLRFAFAGGRELGEAHYYRIQGPTFVLEYANTQNGANHVHASWRNFDGDFGRDLLREHMKAAH